jgi:hypothetical protein
VRGILCFAVVGMMALGGACSANRPPAPGAASKPVCGRLSDLFGSIDRYLLEGNQVSVDQVEENGVVTNFLWGVGVSGEKIFVQLTGDPNPTETWLKFVEGDAYYGESVNRKFLPDAFKPTKSKGTFREIWSPILMQSVFGPKGCEDSRVVSEEQKGAVWTTNYQTEFQPDMASQSVWRIVVRPPESKALVDQLELQ